MKNLMRVFPVLATAGVLAMAGCSADAEFSIGGDTVNESSMEESISEELAKQVGQSPKAVDCPAGVKAAEGEKFECDGTAPNGDEFTIDVTLTDDEGGFRFFVPPVK